MDFIVNSNKSGWEFGSVIEYLPSMHDILGLIPSTKKRAELLVIWFAVTAPSHSHPVSSLGSLEVDKKLNLVAYANNFTEEAEAGDL